MKKLLVSILIFMMFPAVWGAQVAYGALAIASCLDGTDRPMIGVGATLEEARRMAVYIATSRDTYGGDSGGCTVKVQCSGTGWFAISWPRGDRPRRFKYGAACGASSRTEAIEAAQKRCESTNRILCVGGREPHEWERTHSGYDNGQRVSEREYKDTSRWCGEQAEGC